MIYQDLDSISIFSQLELYGGGVEDDGTKEAASSARAPAA
jgi:hypothetical protein